MSRRKEKITVLTSVDATLMKMPKYNPYQTGTGIHASKKHMSRAKRKQQFRRELDY